MLKSIRNFGIGTITRKTVKTTATGNALPDINLRMFPLPSFAISPHPAIY
jgi:hypothetical protein